MGGGLRQIAAAGAMAGPASPGLGDATGLAPAEPTDQASTSGGSAGGGAWGGGGAVPSDWWAEEQPSDQHLPLALSELGRWRRSVAPFVSRLLHKHLFTPRVMGAHAFIVEMAAKAVPSITDALLAETAKAERARLAPGRRRQ